MNREEYIAELRHCLEGLREEEINDAVSYCEEYFNEAQDDASAIGDLGTPSKFAAQLRAETACKVTQNQAEDPKPRSLFKNFVLILIGICALPIALPVLLVILFLIITIAMILFALFVICSVSSIIFIYSCGASFVASITHAQGTGDILVHLGASLLFLGLAILSVLFLRYMVRYGLPFLNRIVSGFYQRYKGDTIYEN